MTIQHKDNVWSSLIFIPIQQNQPKRPHHPLEKCHAYQHTNYLILLYPTMYYTVRALPVLRVVGVGRVLCGKVTVFGGFVLRNRVCGYTWLVQHYRVRGKGKTLVNRRENSNRRLSPGFTNRALIITVTPFNTFLKY